jgi:outer membrane receptor for ferrienterochelin and colicin
MYRHKLNDGILKAFATGSYSNLKYNMPTGSNAATIGNETGNIYTNITANQCLNKKLSYSAGLASSINDNTLDVNDMQVKTFTNNLEARFKLIADISNRIKLITGVSESFNQYLQDYRATATSSTWHGNVDNHVVGIFAEPEFRYGTKFAIRPGIRAEYSTLMGQWQVAPRLSAAYKTGEHSQISAAFGQFFQIAENDYLKFNNNLNSEKATHLIASYQLGDASTRLIRAEAYLKKYQNLVCYDATNLTSAAAYNNSGDGFANGFDLFYRDKKTLKHTDFWISYSYIDTKRKYQNFSTQATPTFVAKHSLNVVSKYFIQPLNSQISGTYTYASPKNYHDPVKPGLMNSQTPYYSDLSVSWSYITHLGNNMTVFYLSVSNVLGRDNIYGYRNTLADGSGSLTPIVPDQKRFVFVGMFINLL